MGIVGALTTIPALARGPGVFLGSREYVLVLSHMRSFSSMLCHVLGSHEEIAGYAEMHQGYEGPIDFLRMRARVSRSLDGRLDGRLVLDKVLHPRHVVTAQIADRQDVHTIFLVREPPATIASLVSMGAKFDDTMARYADPAVAAEYYARRIASLVELARAMQSQALFVTAESVVADTDAALAAITAYLGLGRPLEPTYKTFKHTGKSGFGDFSDRIKSGRIDRQAEPRAVPDVPPPLLEAAWAAHEEWLAAGERHRFASRMPAAP